MGACRDRMLHARLIRRVKRGLHQRETYDVVCPEGLEHERGADLVVEQPEPKVIRWS